jgi:glycosyltransferase involved in cell wall biosynthesis
VAGAAAALLPPDDADAWAGEMRALLADEPRREAMGEAGREQAKRFSWRRCAEDTAAVYRSLA